MPRKKFSSELKFTIRLCWCDYNRCQIDRKRQKLPPWSGIRDNLHEKWFIVQGIEDPAKQCLDILCFDPHHPNYSLLFCAHYWSGYLGSALRSNQIFDNFFWISNPLIILCQDRSRFFTNSQQLSGTELGSEFLSSHIFRVMMMMAKAMMMTMLMMSIGHQQLLPGEIINDRIREATTKKFRRNPK